MQLNFAHFYQPEWDWHGAKIGFLLEMWYQSSSDIPVHGSHSQYAVIIINFIFNLLICMNPEEISPTKELLLHQSEFDCEMMDRISN